MCNGAFVCGLIEEINSTKIGEGNKIGNDHIQEGAFALPGAVLEAWAMVEDEDGKGDIFVLSHRTVMSGGIVKLGAPLRRSAMDMDESTKVSI